MGFDFQEIEQDCRYLYIDAASALLPFQERLQRFCALTDRTVAMVQMMRLKQRRPRQTSEPSDCRTAR